MEKDKILSLHKAQDFDSNEIESRKKLLKPQSASEKGMYR